MFTLMDVPFVQRRPLRMRGFDANAGAVCADDEQFLSEKAMVIDNIQRLVPESDASLDATAVEAPARGGGA